MESDQSSWIPLMKRAQTICCVPEAKKRGRKKGQKSKSKCPTNKITNVFKPQKRAKYDVDDDFVTTADTKEFATIFLTQKQKEERKKDELCKKKIEQEKIELEFVRSLNEGKEANPFLLAVPQKTEQQTEKKEEFLFKLALFPNVKNVSQKWEYLLSNSEESLPFKIFTEDEFIERINSSDCNECKNENQTSIHEVIINQKPIDVILQENSENSSETTKQVQTFSKQQKIDHNDIYKQCNGILATIPFRKFCESVCCASLGVPKTDDDLINPQKGSKLYTECRFFFARMVKSMAAVMSDNSAIWTDISHPVSHLEYLFADQNFFNNWFKQFQPSVTSKNRRSKTEIISPSHSALLLCGKGCCGKTALAEALAKEFDLDIIELNTTTPRDGKTIRSIFGDSFHSQTIGQNVENGTDVRNLFSINAKRRTCKKSNTKSHRALFLFDDIDVLFDKDVGYLQALTDIIETSKHPIIMTANSIERLDKFIFKANPLIVNFQPPPIETIFESIAAILASNGNSETLFSYDELLKLKTDTIYVFDYFHYDIRKLLLFYQFWWKGEKGYTIEQQKLHFQPLYDKLVKIDLKKLSEAIFQSDYNTVSFLLQNSQIETTFENYPFVTLQNDDGEVNDDKEEIKKDKMNAAQKELLRKKLEYDFKQMSAAAGVADSASFSDCACSEYKTKKYIYKEQITIEDDYIYERLNKECKDIEAFSLIFSQQCKKHKCELSFDSFVRNSEFTSQNSFKNKQSLFQKKYKKLFQRRFELFNISPTSCFCDVGPFMALLLKEKQKLRRVVNLSDTEFIEEFTPQSFFL